METLKKLLELIQFGDERIDFELKNQKLSYESCGIEYYKWTTPKRYISSYRYRRDDHKFVCLDINIRSDKAKELIEKVKKQFKVVELVPFEKAKLDSNFMSLEINENTHVIFRKTFEIDFDDDYRETETGKETITIEIVQLKK